MKTTDAQVKGLFKYMAQGYPLYKSAAKADMCENTARKYVQAQDFPSRMKKDRDWRTRPDAFVEVWPRVEKILEDFPHFEAKSAFEWLQREYPGKFQDGQLRTLQRRFRQWRGERGPAREVFFPQDHYPGELGASDYTSMSGLNITIDGLPFPHLVYHYVLTWSNWEHGTVCFSESYESLSEGVQNAWWRCGGVPSKHRTDRLSAAVNNLDEKRDFTKRYDALMRHYGVEGQKTNPASGNENGDAEQRHHRLKRAVEQMLILRGSRDFKTRDDYERFLDSVFDQLNKGREERFAEEQRCLNPLPRLRLPDYTEIREVLVSRASTITVRKNVYSVHSRLRDEHVRVRVYAEHLEVWFGMRLVEKLPRLCGEKNYHIDYRHIIDWLVRKPGAFPNYRYRSELFPTSHFRIAYDQLRKDHPTRADKEYLKILHLAAFESQESVNCALRMMIADETSISSVSVKALVSWLSTNGMPKLSDAHVEPVELSKYDALLSCGEVSA